MNNDIISILFLALLRGVSTAAATKNQYHNFLPKRARDMQVCPSWRQLGPDINGENEWDESGNSVSISNNGDVIAIGAFGNGDNGFHAGHVRVYEWDGETNSWGRRGGDIDGEEECDESGRSVSMSGNGMVIAIGANHNSDAAYYSGHVRVYEFNGRWVQRGGDIDGEAKGDNFGRSVSMSDDGTVVAIGAYLNDGNSRINSGHVRIYKWKDSIWSKRGDDIDGEKEEDKSGFSVSLSDDGTVVAIGAYDNDGNGYSSGHTRVYKWNNVWWSKLGPDINGRRPGDRAGRSVSLSNDGTVVAIGAYGNDSNGDQSGEVRVYKWNGSDAWSQRGANIDGEASGDNSGYSVSISNDGTVVAIGAHNNDGNGDRSGHVRVYEWQQNSWAIRAEFDGEAPKDRSGISVSMSNDGTIVAIGATMNNGSGSTNSGHVRIMKWTPCESPIDLTSPPTTNEPTSLPTTTEPTSPPTTTEPTSMSTTTEPTSPPTTFEPTTQPTTSKPTSSPSTTEPTSQPSTTEPNSPPTTTKPTSLPTTIEPTSPPSTAKPTFPPSTTEPTSPPTTTEPTPPPTTAKPTFPPTTADPLDDPTSPPQCIDSSLIFKVKWSKKKGKMVLRSCIWVGQKKAARCAKNGVSATCPSTCGTCSTCTDSILKARFDWNGSSIVKSCGFVRKKAIAWRCKNISGISNHCRLACGTCT